MPLTPEQQNRLDELEAKQSAVAPGLTLDQQKRLQELEAKEKSFMGSDQAQQTQTQTGEAQDSEGSLPTDRSFLEDVNYVAGDFGNQFNLAVASLVGAPVDLTAFALNAVSNAIIDRDIVPGDSLGGSESIRRAMNLVPFTNIVAEPPRTKVGVVGQVAGEAASFTIPALKVAQVASKAKTTTKAGEIAKNISKQFTDEATKNTGRFLAVESGAVAGASGGRILSQEKDLSPGAALTVEVLTGITGALAGDKTFGLSKGLMNKVRGKTSEEVMEMVASGAISFKDLEWTPTAQTDVGDNAALLRFNEAQNEIANKLVKNQKGSTVVEVENLDNYAPDAEKTPRRIIQKTLSWIAPSKVVGKDVVNEIDKAKGTVARAEDIGERVYRAVKRLEKKDPSVSTKFKDFMMGGDLDPSLKPIEVELETFRSEIKKLQRQLLDGMDDEIFEGLSSNSRAKLREIIEASMDTGYLTQTYKLFQDPNYLPTKAQEAAAINEIKIKILESSEAGTMTVQRAEELAKERINYLASRSARQKKNDGIPQGVIRESQEILKAKTDPGPAERAWLGEVTDPKELAFSTASKLSKLASAKEEDVSIVRFLLDSGLATRESRNPDQVQLKLRTTEGKSGIFVDPEVANSLDLLRFGDQIGESKNPLYRTLVRFWTSWQGVSKGSKVIANPESYPVNLLGAIAMTVSSGIMPNVSGFRRALAEFGALDNVLSGKNTKGRELLLKDIGKMKQYNLMPKSVNAADLEQSVVRGLRNFTNPAANFLDKGYKKGVDFLGKAYSVADVALRYTTWKGNQKQLKKMFPDYSDAEIEAAAARLTNDTFANYDKLSDLIRKLSRVGLLQQFVPFTAELTRNMYNQGKYAMQMARGTFGKDIGLDPARADFKQMSLHGATRGASLLLTVGGSGALVNQYNSNKGIDEESAEAFNFSIAPPWDRNKRLAIKPDKTGRKGRYVNPDYLIPQIMAQQAFEAGFSGKPIEELAEVFKERFIGEPGTFPMRTLVKVAITGRDQNGDLIYTDPDSMEKAKTAIGIIYDETLKPGVQPTIKRWQDTFKGVSDRTVLDNVYRMLGIRDYTWDSDQAFRGVFSDIVEPVSEIKRNFSSARYNLENNKITQDQFEAEYQRANGARSRQMDIMRQHYRNMSLKPWSYSEDERISLMKEAGVSSLEILDIITNKYTDLPRVRALSTSEIYENLEGDKVAAIGDLSNTDPMGAKRLINYHKRLKNIEKRNLSAKDKLILGLDVQQRVKYLQSVGADKNRAVLEEYRRKGIATKDVERALILQRD